VEPVDPPVEPVEPPVEPVEPPVDAVEPPVPLPPVPFPPVASPPSPPSPPELPLFLIGEDEHAPPRARAQTRTREPRNIVIWDLRGD
jgi:autotransporter family porin